jgi:hypothetical protein
VPAWTLSAIAKSDAKQTVVNMGLSSMASGIDAVEKSINYYAETLDPFVPAILLIINESSIILLPRLRKTISSAEYLLSSVADSPVEIWFQDEARVGQKGTHAYVWAPIGSRPPMVRDSRHDSAYPYGAICPACRVGAAIIMPVANAEGMNEHLKEVSTKVTYSWRSCRADLQWCWLAPNRRKATGPRQYNPGSPARLYQPSGPLTRM